jgi:GMP synthase-like glutamine amidotransferase
MKILLVNNNTVHMPALSSSLLGHDVEVVKYQPNAQFNWQNKDLVILSGGGGEGQEIHDTYTKDKLWYEDEMKFVLACNKPIIGICMGFEVIARAYGSDVEPIGKLVQGFKQLNASSHGKKHLSKNYLKQFESHRWSVTKAPKDFEVLADSQYGIEMIRKDNILATQFHPEKGGTTQLASLIKAF